MLTYRRVSLTGKPKMSFPVKRNPRSERRRPSDLPAYSAIPQRTAPSALTQAPDLGSLPFSGACALRIPHGQISVGTGADITVGGRPQHDRACKLSGCNVRHRGDQLLRNTVTSRYRQNIAYRRLYGKIVQSGVTPVSRRIHVERVEPRPYHTGKTRGVRQPRDTILHIGISL